MKNIAIVTGSRAEYGLLKPLIKLFQESADHELMLIVTGMHLSPEFGLTYREILEDDITISHKIDTLLSADSAEAITKSIGVGLISFADVFSNKTDLLIVLGDRTELLSACIAAMVKGIPIAHISGGETTEGAYDEAVRHSITKMSYLHFAATNEYVHRIIQLGECPDRVFNVGAIGIDSIKNLSLLGKNELERAIGFKLGKINLLLTFHPVTLENESAEQQFEALLLALGSFPDTHVIFTKPNSDKGGRVIIRMIDTYVKEHQDTSTAFDSLGQLRYLSCLQYMDAVIGNSSSGIVEVPYFKIPTINIGDRQRGRIMPSSVINCAPTADQITRSISIALSEDFKRQVKNTHSPYGEGGTAQKIFDIISNSSITSVKKKFYDIEMNNEKL